MSLNNNPDLAEKLASEVSLDNLTNFISYARNVENAGLGDYSQDVLVAMEAVKLLTEGLVYAFRVEDDYSERMGGNSDGVYLYRRTGKNKSINIFSWEDINGGDISIPNEFDAIKFLVENNINRIITGPISSEFLGINENYTDDDGDSRKIGILSDSSIEHIRSSGIEVTVLDRLV